MFTRGRIVVLGILSVSPYAGVAWQVLHYLEGFRRLGYEVSYADDTGTWPATADGAPTDDPGFTLSFIADLMSWWGVPDNWFYRSGVDGSCYGPKHRSLSALLADADIIVNLTGSTILREEHMVVPVRIYLETDPFLPQIEVAQGRQSTIDALQSHTHFFTFGENIGTRFCDVPIDRFAYVPTRQPVIIDWWESPSETARAAGAAPFTTITSWKQSSKDIEWQGERYLWSKHEELLKFLDAPKSASTEFHLAIATREAAAIDLLQSHGWCVSDAVDLTTNGILPYRRFIQCSRGEFTVAKDQYVRPNTGWFSDRSASYLAAGRPVITQETGFSRFLPVGEGLFSFESMNDVQVAVDDIQADYSGNCRAATEIAREYFSAERVLTDLLERIQNCRS